MMWSVARHLLLAVPSVQLLLESGRPLGVVTVLVVPSVVLSVVLVPWENDARKLTLEQRTAVLQMCWQSLMHVLGRPRMLLDMLTQPRQKVWWEYLLLRASSPQHR